MSDQELIRITDEPALRAAGIPFKSVQALRWHAQQAKLPSHPFHKAFVRFGARVHVDPAAFHAAARGEEVQRSPSVAPRVSEPTNNSVIAKAATAAAKHGMKIWRAGETVKTAYVDAMQRVVLEFPSWDDAYEYLESVAPRARRRGPKVQRAEPLNAAG